ncbi:MAG: chaperonin GroEL, partial [Myxococcales bacterium]|nr:chaperonin GroEL [Myxococcales bacterium]
DLSLTVDTTLDVLEGASYERGYVSHHMVTDVETMQVLLDDVVILLTDQGLASEEDVESLRKLAAEARKPMLLIAEDYAPEAVAALLRPSDGPQIVCVHAPEYGKWRRAMMEDLAVMTGARVFVKELGHRFQDAALSDLGEARGVRISSDTTVISGGRGDPEAIRGRIAQVKRQAELNEVLIEEDKFNERLAKLSGGIAVVHAGGATPVEQKRRAQLIEDALNATRAAIEEGVVPGGGVALLQCQSILEGVSGDLSPGRRRGVEIVKVALGKPLTWIAENSGVDAKRVIDQVLAAPAGTGYDARSGALVPMIDAGIADPVRVTTQALINAASVAKLVLTTHTLITDVPDDVDPTAEPARGGGAERLGMD